MDVNLDRVHTYLDWLKTKIFLDNKATNASKRIVKRGNVYRCYLGRGIGSEEEKERPCVVLQRFDGNVNSPNTIVAPITHTATLSSPEMKLVDIAMAKSLDIWGNFVTLNNIIKDKDVYIGKLIHQRENLQRQINEMMDSK